MPESNRRDNNPVSEALDALSFFLSGLLMRWVVLHRMSPSHGYLHRTVDFNSLVYDLMEPIRHWSEQAVMVALLERQDQSDLLPRSISVLKSMLAQNVEVPSLQIEANRKNILHGVVLAIRSYILGECDVLNFPLDGQERTKGRPVKAAYQVPGAKKRHR
jgi:CRISPR/Cas system-associated endonuclease Cas1